MKVISLLQPWASLVVLGHKKIETRSWNTKHRGPLLIHAGAGKNVTNAGIQLDFQQEFFHLHLPKYDSLPFGAIIGQVNVCGTVRMGGILDVGSVLSNTGHAGKEWPITEQEKAFGNYAHGRWLWLLSDAQLFQKPIPAKGSLGFWQYDLNSAQSVPG